MKKCMMAAILICGSTTMLTSCSDKEDNAVTPDSEIDKDVMNKKITDGNYDKFLAVKCINGTFVGKKAENIISYKGIPFVGQQPVGNLRWKAPVDVTSSNDVYEAYNYCKAPVQRSSRTRGHSCTVSTRRLPYAHSQRETGNSCPLIHGKPMQTERLKT